jgi:hypothetical protein
LSRAKKVMKVFYHYFRNSAAVSITLGSLLEKDSTSGTCYCMRDSSCHGVGNYPGSFRLKKIAVGFWQRLYVVETKVYCGAGNQSKLLCGAMSLLWATIRLLTEGIQTTFGYSMNSSTSLDLQRRNTSCTRAHTHMRAICEVRGLTLLLRVWTMWRCGDGLFFEVPPLTSDALLKTPHPLFENALQTVNRVETSCLGALFSWLEKPRNDMERDLNWILCSAWKKWIGGTTLEHPPCSPDLTPCDFWAFPTMERELWGKKFRSD